MSDITVDPAAGREPGPSPALTGSLAARVGSARPIPPVAIRIATRFADLALLGAVGAVTHGLATGAGPGPFGLAAITLVPIVAMLCLDTLGAYRIDALQSVTGRIKAVGLSWLFAMGALLAAAFFLQLGDQLPRTWFGAWLISGFAGLVVIRLVVRHVTRVWAAQGRLDRRAVIVGGGDTAAELIRALERSTTASIRIVGVFDDRGVSRVGAFAHYPTLGSFDDLVSFARTERVDMLIVALPLTAESRLLQLLRKLWVLPVDIRISALSSRLRFRPRAYSWIGDVPFLDVFDRPLSGSDVIVKAVFDRVIGATALILLAPVMLLTALAIKIDSRGPILFKQKRYGFNNELIEVFKFRSMYADQSDRTAAKLVTKDDPRVTRVGRFIRKTSLDELPQLFNVVFYGNLSLVGPRPHAVHAKAADTLYQDTVDGYFARHKVKPGITGWAQINGWRGETDTAEKLMHRVECDLHYIENWSPLFDAYILAMTPISLVTKSENAY